MQTSDQDTLDIQTAAVLCGFGDKSSRPAELLYNKADWRAKTWLAEHSSLRSQDSDAYDLVEESLDLILKEKPDTEMAQKGILTLLEWMWYWNSLSRNLQIREKMIA